MSNPMEKHINDALEIVLTLRKAIYDAGGNADSILELERLSARELLAIMAGNNIRFYYKGKN